MAKDLRARRELKWGIFFLLPNIIGVMCFTILPVIASALLSFTDYSLMRQNAIKWEWPSFVGIRNYVDMLTDGNFWQAFGNTLYLMMLIPFSVGGALGLAILLSKNYRGKEAKTWLFYLVSAVFVVCIIGMTVVGMGASAMVILLSGIACLLFIMGSAGGSTVYRTLFYMPHFTAGAATFLLWKRMYAEDTGPLNNALRPVLRWIHDTTVGIVGTDFYKQAEPTIAQFGLFAMVRAIGFLIAGLIFLVLVNKLRKLWRDGEVGHIALGIGVFLASIPVMVMLMWGRAGWAAYVQLALVILCLAIVIKTLSRGRVFTCSRDEGTGTAMAMGLAALVGQFITLGLTVTIYSLPLIAVNDIEAPSWLGSTTYSKPAMMIVMFWGAVGSNNMILYLAALTNVPQELYEAADIDGAGRFQRFWNVTWPQLAPTTFFIAVMATIRGLQGGFEIARVLTNGGPAGSTTTLSFLIYDVGFQTGNVAKAAAIAWILFILVFVMTIINWRFGNRYVND